MVFAAFVVIDAVKGFAVATTIAVASSVTVAVAVTVAGCDIVLIFVSSPLEQQHTPRQQEDLCHPFFQA